MRAMILCAGYGTRLGSLTEEIPKPMLPLAGKPILEYIICNLREHGFRDIAINLHFKPEVIPNYFQNGVAWGVKLHYSYEPELLGTAGGIKRMESFLAGEDFFLIHYGDVLTDQHYSAMVQYHKKKKALGTLLLHKRARSNSIVKMDDTGRISFFMERPTLRERSSHALSWVNSGVCILGREIFSRIPSEGFSDLPKDVFSKTVKEGSLFGYPLSGYRCAVDSPTRYKEAQEAIINKECQIDCERRDLA